MPIVNTEVIAAFTEIADLLDIEGANPFRVRAYRNAARMLGELGHDVKTMVDKPEDLDALPGIGPDLAGKIVEIVTTGSCALLQRLRKEVAPTLVNLLKVPGLGPKRVRALNQELGIETLDELHRAAEQGHISAVHGFGVRSERKILAAASAFLQQDRRYKLVDIDVVAQTLLSSLGEMAGVQRVVAAGSLRRRRETVGDLDLLASTSYPREMMDRLSAGADVDRILEKGITRCSVLLKSGLQVDLRAIAPISFGAAWLYFTGSKAHNIAMRKMAQAAGLKLNEYGLYRGRKRIAGATEDAVFKALGLPFIEPELRENRGEIEAGLQGELPRLVTLSDLCGDLHAHTLASDGVDTLESMAAAAQVRGLHYLAITEHSKNRAFPHGLDAQGLSRQIDQIDELNAQRSGIVLLKSVEVGILEDGALDLPDTILRRLDLVVGAIHSGFGLGRDQQTARLLRAMDNPCFSLLAHPTGRLINERAPYDIDLPRVIGKARERGCFLELNAQPARLDLTDEACRMAKSEGVLVSINADAHSCMQFDHLAYGINQARRGWLEARDVLNTRTLDQLRPLLRATMNPI